MTTIAYKDGVIAYDSRVTDGDTIISNSREKKIKVNGVLFIFSGIFGDIEQMVHLYFSKEYVKPLGCNAIVYDSDGLKLIGTDEEQYFENTIPFNEYSALGSGSPYAYGAMDAGATAKQAVQIAAQRDVYTGGKIRTVKIREY